MDGLNPSKKEVPVFDPNDPAYRGMLWVTLRSTAGKFRHYFWRRIAVVVAVLAVLGWLGTTGAVWANLKLRRRFTEVHYVDLVLPWRWPRYLTAMSEHYVAMGNEALAHGAADTAFYFYNAALALRPNNHETRRLAALSQFHMGARPVALAAMTAGLAEAAASNDEAYLRQYFSMAFELQADDEAYAAGLAVLPAQPDQLRTHKFIAFQLATTRFERNDYAAAEKLLTDWGLRDAMEGSLLYNQCLWEGGRRDTAVADLQDGLQRFRPRDSVYAVLEQIDRTLQQPEDVLALSILRQLADPDHLPPQLDLIYAYHAAGRLTEEHQAVAAYCAKFSNDPAGLPQLLQFGVDAAEPAVAQQARDLTATQKHPLIGYDVGCAEAAILGQDWPATEAAVARLKADKSPTSKTYDATLAGLEMLIKFGREDSTAAVVFANYLTSAGALRATDILLYAKALKALHQPDFAHQLLAKGFASYPDYEPLLLELVRADVAARDHAQLADHLPVLLKKRKVPRDLLEPALPLLNQPPDAALRNQVTALLEHTPPLYLTTQR